MSVDTSSLIDHYVELLKEGGWIRSQAVEVAFRRVPRHLLIEKVYSGRLSQPDVLEIDSTNPEHLAMVYSNRTLVIRWYPELSSSSEPALVALMLELLALQPGMRVLEVGAGSGYNAALVAELVGDPGLVTTLDVQADLAEQTRQRLIAAGYGRIHVQARDGFYGYEAHAPYDRIVATVACSDLSPHWVTQLAPDGFMLIPLSHGGVYHCPLLRVQQDGDRITGRVVGYSGFMAIRGDEFPQSLWSFSPNEDERWLSSQLQSVQPESEHPLFPDLKAFPDSAFRLPAEWAGLYEFHYFLALHTRQAFVCWKGTGLGNEQGLVLLNKEGSIQLYGDRAPALYQELEEIHRQWVALGKPRMADYRLEFIPLLAASEPGPDLGSNTWMIDRKFCRQIVRL
jgi:protein-L-isoaspartate(D-aspartate) O-methyltransferase